MLKITPRDGEKNLFNVYRSFLSQIKRIRNLIYIITPAILVSIFIHNDYGYILLVSLMSLAAIYSLYIFWIWYQNVVIVTNQRIIVVARKSFFQLTYDEIEAADIENIKYEIKGLLPTIFRYGSIIIEMRNAEEKKLEFIHGLQVVHTSLKALVSAINHK